jgi:ferredoxin
MGAPVYKKEKEMAKLIIDGLETEVPDGTTIEDACEKMGVPMGCTAGECGTCVITVIKGMENLKPKNDMEKERGIEDEERLACQAEIRSGTVEATW